MFADRVVAWCDTKAASHILDNGAKRLKEDVFKAVKFDLSQGVMASTYALFKTPLTQRMQAYSFSKLPFKHCWFERDGIVPGRPEKGERGTGVDGVPTRVGVYVRCDSSLQKGECHWIWEVDGIMNPCPLATSFDWSDNPDITRGGIDPSPMPFKSRQEHMASDVSDSTLAILKSMSDFEWDNLKKRTGVFQSRYWHETVIKLMKRYGSNPPPEWESVMDMARDDLQGEAELFRCAIMLMNSKNLTKVYQVDIDPKSNKTRRQLGKRPLMPYRSVKINLSAALSRRAGAGAGTATGLHIVRGHFKIRKTGVFWWSPFVRGDESIGTINRSSYSITG